jgi:F-type H+-transporting ATPase subunit epsilon
MPLELEIVTAERQLLAEDNIDVVIAPGSEGELAILPRHAPLMTILEMGELRYRRGGDETSVAVTGGFMEVRNNKVTVLADAAEKAEDIDEARAEAARQRAQQRLTQRPSELDLVRAEIALRRSLLRLRVAERRRNRAPRPPRPGL